MTNLIVEQNKNILNTCVYTYCLGTGVRTSGEFAPVSSRIRIVHVKIAKSLEKLRWRPLVCED